MNFIYLMTYVLGKSIVYQFDANPQIVDYWVMKSIAGAPLFSNCGGYNILGGNGYMNQELMRNFQLPAHYRIYLDITFNRFGSWNSDVFNIYLDNILMYSQQYSGSQLCGDSQIQITIESQHNSNFAVIYMKAQDIDSDNNESWGISHLTLSIEPCPHGCQYCESKSLECKEWSLQYWQLTQNFYYYFNHILYNDLDCHGPCFYTLFLPQHNKFTIRFRLYVCGNENLQFDVLKNNIIYKSITLVNDFALCQLLDNIVPFSNHIENRIDIKIQRTGGTYIFLDIKDFQVFIHRDFEQDSFIQGCLQIIQQVCWECQEGWLLEGENCTKIIENKHFLKQDNLQTYSQQLNCEKGFVLDTLSQCIPICGNQIVQGLEECDDGNDFQYDGCYNCKYQCQLNCLDCKFGICQQCLEGYNFNNNVCEPNCGDGIIIPYYEQCDDQNDDQGDGCYQCQFECMGNCIKCFSFVCLECQIGFQLIQNECITICGDKIKTEYEDCDDGNDIQYDGCYQCQYQCNNKCQSCIQGVCKDQCNYGDIMINYQCQSVCGNQIVSGKEECDDGNNIQYDGCYQCQYQCTEYCDYCERGVCLECISGFELKNQTCIDRTICGDGMIGLNEECDDGNNDSNDGCYDCLVEENWVCDQSMCILQFFPEIILKLINSSASQQFVQLTFSQEVKLTDSGQVITMKIANLPEENYNLSIFCLKNLTTELSNPEYAIQIIINGLMNDKPILQVDLEDIVVNQYDMNLKSTTEQIKLQNQVYLDPHQKAASQQISNFNQNIIYCLAVISVLSLLSGESSVIQDILNILQQLSFLRFINVQYPDNINIFFQFTDMISITPFLQFTNLDSCFDLATQMIPTYGKFAEYKLEANLLSNLACQFLQIVAFILLLFFSKLFQKTIFTNLTIAKYFYCMSQLAAKFNSQHFFKFSKILFQQIRSLLRAKSIFTLEGLKQLFLLNSWDLLFKVFLYMKFMSLTGYQDYFQLFVSLLIGILYAGIVIYSLKKSLFFKMNELLEIVTLMKQFLFLSLLIFIESDIQTVPIIITNFTYLVIIVYMFKRKINFVQLIVEVIIILFTLISILYMKDFSKIITPETKIILGFAQIAVVVLGLMAQILGYIVIKIKQVLKIIKERQQNSQRKTISNLFI